MGEAMAAMAVFVAGAGNVLCVVRVDIGCQIELLVQLPLQRSHSWNRGVLAALAAEAPLPAEAPLQLCSHLHPTPTSSSRQRVPPNTWDRALLATPSEGGSSGGGQPGAPRGCGTTPREASVVGWNAPCGWLGHPAATCNVLRRTVHPLAPLHHEAWNVRLWWAQCSDGWWGGR